MEKQYGLDLVKELLDRRPEDWEYLGGVSQKCIAQIPLEERESCLPKGERQDIGEEKMDCASRAPANLLETKFNWLHNQNLLPKKAVSFLAKNGYVTPWGIEFSDAFVAIKSGTTRQGNSLIAPIEAIHKHGLIPKSMLPQVNSFDAYYDPKRITPAMENLGKKFLTYFQIEQLLCFLSDF